MRFASLLLLSALLATPAIACPAMGLSLEPVTPDGGTIRPGGGVLLQLVAGPPQSGPNTFRLEDSKGAVAATSELIAPGLERLTPKQHAMRDLTLVGSEHKLTIRDAAATPALAAPKLAKTFSTRSRTSKPPAPPYPMAETTTIMLAAAPPADAYAIILYGPDKQPRAYLPVTAKKTTYQLSFGGKGCGGVGASGTLVGESITIAFVDTAGRVTAQSKAARVAAVK